MSSGFGTWPSPLSAADLVADTSVPNALVEDGDCVWWSESRPAEAGRSAIMRLDEAGDTVEVLGPDANVRTRVHEYGGGAWTVDRGVLYYCDFADQRMRRIDPDGSCVVLTGEPATQCGVRYADLTASPDGSWIYCVREDHDVADVEPRNDLVAVAADGSGSVRVLAERADFYSSPRPSPDGTRLAWIAWNHPNMPWDDTELWVANLDGGEVSSRSRVADGSSLQQPRWSPTGRLHVIADVTGAWQIHTIDESAELSLVVEPVRAGRGEIGAPPWVFGEASYRFAGDALRVVDTRPGEGDRLVEPDGTIGPHTEVATIGVRSEIAASWTREHAVYVDGRLATQAKKPQLPDEFLPAPTHIEASGAGGPVHAWYYAPANPDVVAPDSKPPLLVMAHGGPTGAARTGLQLGLRYWTSRGFAVVDVDYRGSTGYGTEYRNKLAGLWGVADVEDCIAATQHLVDRGLADADRLGIRGGSAGGLTVLGALVASDLFTAGVSRYGVADLEALVADTHKFEARYLDGLVGRLPEAVDVYRERSPIHHVEQIAAPMLVLQGLDDPIVPPNQSEAIVDALRANDVPVEYLAFEGEAHGFRKAETIIASLEAELAFYTRTWDLG